METASFQTHKKTFSTIDLKENRITSTLTVFWNNNIPGFFYSQWIKWCQVLCLILPFLITLSKTCWHSLAWLRTNSAIQPDFRLHSDQTRSLCSLNSPEKNVHLKVQYQITYFQQHSLSTLFREEKVGDKGAVWRGHIIAGQVIMVYIQKRLFSKSVHVYNLGILNV